ncbi:FtsW/RodA/SpoVE family cell cycle protein [Thermanaerothrix sp. 4228-RoL]|jgi:rod shape determining protein RodA|uniref:FtsW/RodA/SpoVE family cell cycle protein n=1 Tax=Thermanaerothrix solaris TaxID=3058434 RepID=A0ABU3NQQ1_9CHLR|nr:FtsW/RodA/SpoVE family cell cycle protein [Thermanaerothrix sp. 4228-RoL]MDT8899164.1 FtsW/RodA/SpoVE family cell cycle protein [Thermanaerothrix sp. 4228-RoL]
MILRRETWRRFDFWLFGAVLILCIFGIIMIRSAIAGNAQLAESVTRQIIYVSVGLVVLLGTALIDYRIWGSLTRILYAVALLSLIGIYILGRALFGSARWFDTGVILIQPSELVKIIMILVLADYFARSADAPKNLLWILRSFLLTAGVVIWILLQPNLSTSIVIMVIWFSLLWISGLPLHYLVIFILLGLIGSVAAFPFLADYQKERILSFLFPDPNARHGNVYNVEQALIAIGSGGLLGMGYGNGTQVQLRFLKVRHTDFIFSAMAEEFGFVGTVVVIALLVFVIWRCLYVARHASDRFGALIAYGVATLLFFQTAVNIGVNLNVIPVTGLTLPFVSYGGSSLLSLVLAIGLVESVAVHRTTLDF